MTDPITAALEQGRTAAAALAGNAAAPANALVPANNGGGQAVAVMTPGARLTMGTMMVQGLSVDAFLKPNEFGTITVGDDKKQQESIDVEIDTSAIMFSLAIKYGNPAQYVKSYDGRVANTGGTFADAINKAQAAVGNTQIIKPYNCADIPMVLVQTLPKQDAKAEPFAVGMKLGYSTPTTGWDNFESFINVLKSKGLYSDDGAKATVRVRLTCQPRVNKKGNNWGVIAFTFLEEVVEQADAA